MINIPVIMCALNSEETIFESIKSFLIQTFTDFELIIINDDDSTDNTNTIVESIMDSRQKLCLRLQVIYLEI